MRRCPGEDPRWPSPTLVMPYPHRHPADATNGRRSAWEDGGDGRGSCGRVRGARAYRTGTSHPVSTVPPAERLRAVFREAELPRRPLPVTRVSGR